MKKITALPIAIALIFLSVPTLLQAQSCTNDVTSIGNSYNSEMIVCYHLINHES